MDLKTEFLKLLNAGLAQAECLAVLADHGEQFPAHAEQVEQTDELELDDKPLYSRSDNGVWVSAWVYVGDPEPVENTECERGQSHQNDGDDVCARCDADLQA